ncbi:MULTISPECIES: thioredoxin domain-containing protein [unclassified Butyricimonas]|uniref:thioredoxin family protein n=1 Tax=unclassified Butyricimonas TaxID=2637652 RepID=UPI00159BB9F9|nr:MULTISPECIES: thioredoxin domain-containing protein [unclassified Butyricimonas]
MKKNIFIVLIVTTCITAFGQDGIHFESLTFKEALAKAKREKKLVFLDCYTSWCGPCKSMEDNIFPLKEAGDYFNPRFVSIKLDMEKGEGVELDKKLGIAGYPTFFIFTPDGNIQHKLMGGARSLEIFISRIEKGMKKETSYGYLRDLYDANKIGKKQLINYKIALMDAFEIDRLRQVEHLLDSLLTVKDKQRKEYWPIIKGYGSDDFKLVINNLSKFRKCIGTQEVNQYLSNNFRSAIPRPTKYKSEADDKRLQQLLLELQMLDLPQKEVLLIEIELTQAIKNNDFPRIILLLKKYVVHDNLNFELIFSIMRELYSSVTTEESQELMALRELLIEKCPEAQQGFLNFFFGKLLENLNNSSE